MNYPERDETAAQIERLARLVAERDETATAALHFAAALLGGTEPSVRLALLLDALPIVALLAATTSKLYQQAEAGDERAREAAAHIRAAGVVLTE